MLFKIIEGNDGPTNFLNFSHQLLFIMHENKFTFFLELKFCLGDLCVQVEIFYSLRTCMCVCVYKYTQSASQLFL
jgi:hypothetical protein